MKGIKKRVSKVMSISSGVGLLIFSITIFVIYLDLKNNRKLGIIDSIKEFIKEHSTTVIVLTSFVMIAFLYMYVKNLKDIKK